MFRVEFTDHRTQPRLSTPSVIPATSSGQASPPVTATADHLELWLLTHTTTGFGRLAVTNEGRAGGTDPARRWGGAALYTDDTISYLITRDLNDDVAELGVVTCGPQHVTLAETTVSLLNEWDKTGPGRATVTAYRNPTPISTPGYLTRPETTLTVKW